MGNGSAQTVSSYVGQAICISLFLGRAGRIISGCHGIGMYEIILKRTLARFVVQFEGTTKNWRFP